jgi:hypothetical protein
MTGQCLHGAVKCDRASNLYNSAYRLGEQSGGLVNILDTPA